MPLPETLLSAPLADLDLVVTRGKMPDGLRGEMIISAPVVDDRLGYQLFGFGALIRIALSPGTYGAPADAYPLRHRVIDSPVYRLHQKAQERFVGGLLGFDTPWGAPNMANTAPLPFGDRLLATWDVGRPVEVDPLTLGFLAEVGSQRSWGGGSFGLSQPLPFVFSTAHPVVDPERGCLWTVKLALGPLGMQPWVVRYDGTGTEVSMWPLEGAAVTGSMHTVSQTRDWLVLADSGNFKADFGEMMGGERTVTVDDGAPVFFVRKAHLEATAAGSPVAYSRSEVAPTTGHFYAVWDDHDGVRVLFEHMDLLDLGFRLRPDDVDAYGRTINPNHLGMYHMAMSPQSVSEWTFDPERGEGRRLARYSGEDTFNLQLSAQDWSPAGQASPTHHHVVFQGFRGEAVARRVLDVYGDRVDPGRYPGADQASSLVTLGRGDLTPVSRYEFPSNEDLPSSPIFVARAGGAPGGGDGWVVVPVLNDRTFRIEVFEAAAVGRGPVATLAPVSPTPLPFVLHSVWTPAAQPAPAVERLAFADDVDPDMLAALDDEARRTVLEVMDELAVPA